MHKMNTLINFFCKIYDPPTTITTAAQFSFLPLQMILLGSTVKTMMRKVINYQGSLLFQTYLPAKTKGANPNTTPILDILFFSPVGVVLAIVKARGAKEHPSNYQFPLIMYLAGFKSSTVMPIVTTVNFLKVKIWILIITLFRRWYKRLHLG